MRMRRVSRVVLVPALVAAFLLAADRESVAGTSKAADVDKLMTVAKVDKLADQMVGDLLDAMEQQFRRTFPNMPPDALTVLMGEMQGSLHSARPELMQHFVALYEREYSHKEIKALIALYRTPLGKKLLRSTRRLTRRSSELSRQWGHKHGLRASGVAMRKIESMGYDTSTFR